MEIGFSKGTVFPERYHVAPLTSPRQVRHAISYVPNNWRRHREDLAGLAQTRASIDPYASGVRFDGWKRRGPFIPPEGYLPLQTVYPQTWLLTVGWRRHGPIDPREVPGPIDEAVVRPTWANAAVAPMPSTSR